MAVPRGVVAAAQRLALRLSYAIHRPLSRRLKARRPISWVVGPDECASMVIQIAGAIPGSYSVSFTEEPAYAKGYDQRFRTRADSHWRWVERVLYGPILLGRLMNQAQGFIYVGSSGFLLDGVDQREFEFRYLKQKSLPVVCYWCGSDIRSTKKMHELEAAMGLPNISTYIGQVGGVFETTEWDELKRRIAEVADRYADAHFSNTVDHTGYLTTPSEPFLYFLPDEDFGDCGKFAQLDRLVVVHATSSPVIKGTQLVRAAVSKLVREGYDFEYVELIGVPNAEVKAQLARAHIAMNQFYGFSPAVFGAEALAAGCVVMMSSDEHVESDLPAGSNQAWVVTKHDEVADKLRQLLDNPGLLEPIAQKGLAWGRRYASRSGAGAIMARTLDSVLAGTYTPGGPRA